MAAGKAMASALTLMVFVVGLTLDDLHLLRFPLLYPATGLAIVTYAFTPPWLASRLLARVSRRPGAASGIEGALVRRRAFLGFAVALFVVWLVMFSAGRTPRW